MKLFLAAIELCFGKQGHKDNKYCLRWTPEVSVSTPCSIFSALDSIVMIASVSFLIPYEVVLLLG
jgi:hypothetical protein